MALTFPTTCPSNTTLLKLHLKGHLFLPCTSCQSLCALPKLLCR